MDSNVSDQQSMSGGKPETRTSGFITAPARSDVNKTGSKQTDDTWTNKFNNVSISRILRLLQLILLQLMQTEEERSSFRDKARFVQETTDKIGRLAASTTINHESTHFVMRMNEEKEQLEVDLASFDKQLVSIQQAEGDLRRLEHELKDWLENVEPQIKRVNEEGGGGGDKQLYSDQSGVCAKSASSPSSQSTDMRLKTYFSLLGDIKIMEEDMNALDRLHLKDEEQREHFRDQGRTPAIADEEFEAAFTAQKDMIRQNLAEAHQRAHSLHHECVDAGLDIEKSRWRKTDHDNPVSWNSPDDDNPRASRLKDWLEDLAHPSTLDRMSTPHLTTISSCATPDPSQRLDRSFIAFAQPVPEAYTVVSEHLHGTPAVLQPQGFLGTERGQFEKQVNSSSEIFRPWKSFYPHNVEPSLSEVEYKIALSNAGYPSQVPGISRGATTHEAHAANLRNSAAMHSMSGSSFTWPPTTAGKIAQNVDAVQNDARELSGPAQLHRQMFTMPAEARANAVRDIPQASIHPDQFAKAVKPAAFFKIGKVFTIQWAEPAGNTDSRSSTASTNIGILGNAVFSAYRRFVVIRESVHSCSVLPIVSYHGQGVSKRGVEKSDHCIIYAGKNPRPPLPNELPERGKAGMRQPVQVELDHPWRRLDDRARLNYGKVYTVEHNIKVCSVGMVSKASLLPLQVSFRQVWARGTRTNTLSSRQAPKTDVAKELVSLGYTKEQVARILKRDGGQAQSDPTHHQDIGI